jgi:hypothetical protein
MEYTLFSDKPISFGSEDYDSWQFMLLWRVVVPREPIYLPNRWIAVQWNQRTSYLGDEESEIPAIVFVSWFV